MSDLTPNDVRRWDSAAVRNVFQVANAGAGKWELGNLNPFEGDPFVSHTTKLADPFTGGIPAVATAR